MEVEDPNIQIYNFESKAAVDTSKDMRRFLYLAPSYPQKRFNAQTSGLETLSTKEEMKRFATFGTGIDGLWDKKFKVRIKSKSTGKIIDINLIFSVNRD